MIASIYNVECVIHGDAKGADRMAGEWAEMHCIPVTKFPASWNLHKRAAGPIRNEKMLKEGKPDLVIAFPGGNGTKHMVKISKEADVKVIDFNNFFPEQNTVENFLQC